MYATKCKQPNKWHPIIFFFLISIHSFVMVLLFFKILSLLEKWSRFQVVDKIPWSNPTKNGLTIFCCVCTALFTVDDIRLYCRLNSCHRHRCQWNFFWLSSRITHLLHPKIDNERRWFVIIFSIRLQEKNYFIKCITSLFFSSSALSHIILNNESFHSYAQHQPTSHTAITTWWKENVTMKQNVFLC